MLRSRIVDDVLRKLMLPFTDIMCSRTVNLIQHDTFAVWYYCPYDSNVAVEREQRACSRTLTCAFMFDLFQIAAANSSEYIRLLYALNGTSKYSVVLLHSFFVVSVITNCLLLFHAGSTSRLFRKVKENEIEDEIAEVLRLAPHRPGGSHYAVCYCLYTCTDMQGF